ncbi:MAG: hypothetical protein OXH47_10170 [Paracoccaceae bacterium]|nr:hypothetical protein [Paracoccaceae bacterium]
MNDLVNLAKQMPGCNRMGRNEAIIEFCKKGESYKTITGQFGILVQRFTGLQGKTALRQSQAYQSIKVWRFQVSSEKVRK